ncbi:MAG: arginine--tRNA ligase [Phycisphaerales bacterium]|nr:arginine--tRNA ligase [Phycisphaerales bacterium]
MKSILQELKTRVGSAVRRLDAEADPLVRASTEDQHGDYQSNCAMSLAKKLGRPPRSVAEEILRSLDIADLCEPPQIAGPGFINLRLRPDALASRLAAIPPAPSAGGDRLGIDPVEQRETVVVDLSSPNLAKEMHVGHLRSTVIGDCVCRILEFLGHDVIRENHVGDWGTQFGMLVAFLRRAQPDVLARPDSIAIADLEAFYIQAKALFDADPAFKKESQETVVALQQGDAATRLVWQAFCNESLRHCHRILDRLGVAVIDRGESFYNDLMPKVLDRLTRDGHAVESQGALCMFLEGFKTKEGEPLPLLIRKSDGGYNYATSDLATLVHRFETLGARRVIYVVGMPQKLHFEMLFAAAYKSGIAPATARLEHLAFGSMLAKSGAPFKTREGGTIKLKDLLDSAVARARQVIESSAAAAQGDAAGPIESSGSSEGADDPFAAAGPGDLAGPSAASVATRRSLTSAQMEDIAEVVGLAAVKYFDLSHNLAKDYRFDLDAMTSLEGNTAPYMLYAYARIRAIGRKAGVDYADLPAGEAMTLEHPSEIALARAVLRLPEILDQAAADLKPNLLTDYLYDLSKSFSRFYDRKLGVRVIDAPTPALRLSRLRLCDLTARALALGLSLLGIRTLEQM